jgi:HSP20 family molecular chaperone IbpA
MTTQDSTQMQTAESAEPARDRRVLTPPTDILESDAGFELRVDLPGADPASIDVTFEQGVLTLRATPKSLDREGFSRSLSEFELADYERKFRVTEAVDPDRIEADYKHGVLHLRVPKLQPTRRRIEVHAS